VRKVTGSGDQRAAQVGAGRLNPLLAVPIQVPGAPGASVEQRAALGQGDCARLACGRPFQRRRSGGISQRFCTTRCRRLADAEFRHAARATPPPLPASSSGPARRFARQRSTGYWHNGIDGATGRRMPLAIRPPLALTVLTPKVTKSTDPEALDESARVSGRSSEHPALR
jgi:hypothetical protein